MRKSSRNTSRAPRISFTGYAKPFLNRLIDKIWMKEKERNMSYNSSEEQQQEEKNNRLSYKLKAILSFIAALIILGILVF